jgi:hypothetical protein
MFWGTWYVLVSGWKGTFKWASRWERKKFAEGKIRHLLGNALCFSIRLEGNL